MKTLSLIAALASCLVLDAPALADEADKAACANLDEGDACTRGDGDPGTCVPDESDPAVLTCEDEGEGGAAADDGCSASGQAPAQSGYGSALLLLSMIALRARRSR